VESYVLAFVQSFKMYFYIFFIIQRDVLVMYQQFDYKLQKSTLITFTRWLPWRK